VKASQHFGTQKCPALPSRLARASHYPRSPRDPSPAIVLNPTLNPCYTLGLPVQPGLTNAERTFSAAGVHVLLNLQELELKPVHFNVDIPAGEIDYDQRLKQTSALHAQGSAEMPNNGLDEVRIRGSLAVTVEAACDRCLETARVPIEKDFDLHYLPAEQFAAGGEALIEEEASEVAYYDSSRLDLNDILREVVLLALPMQVVCSETCKGICPSCGQNRNVKECRCETRALDDRWSKLKALRTELSPGH
jgi:uncharacterized protein